MKRFSLHLEVAHSDMPQVMSHTDLLDVDSITALLRQLSIPNARKWELRTKGETTWVDTQGGKHTLTLEELKA